MTAKKKKRTITLKKRQVRRLNVDELAEARGGLAQDTHAGCFSIAHESGANHNQALRARVRG
jgi:hypothetical protein